MPPRLLTLTTPTVRNQRTLVWLQQHDPLIKWNKWDTVVSSLADYRKWYDLDARIVGMVLTDVPKEVESFIDELHEISKQIQLVLVSQAILSLKPEDFWIENFDNLICLDIILDSYPFLNHSWDGSLSDGIAIFTHLCRYHRLVDVPVSETRLEAMNPIQVVSNMVPQETWLITQFFHHTNPTRHAEILTCLQRNIECPYIDRIILLNEKDLSKEWNAIPGSNKVSQVIIKKRLTYANFLQFVHDEVPANVFTILSNSDIYFGRSLTDLYDIDLRGRMMALLRWDDPGCTDDATIFGPRADSQDAWIFLSDTIRDSNWPYPTFDFPLGQPGCDNAFAAHLLRNHIVLSNPALTFKTYHLHNSDVRNYSKKDTIRSDLYINLVPTYIIDTKQEQVPLGSPACICNQLVSFEVKSSSLSNEITYCTMLEKDGRYKWEATVENNYFEPAIPVYRWTKSCITSNGLVYDPYTIYVGKHIEEFPYWRGANVDIFTPMHRRNRMLAIPFADSSVFQHPDTYVLQYVSRAARLLQDYPGSSFWMPKGMDLSSLDWKVGSSQVVSLEEPAACWAEEVVGFVPGPHSLELGHEDIQVLRSLLPSWKRGPTRQICVVVVDSTITNRFVLERLTTFLKRDDPD